MDEITDQDKLWGALAWVFWLFGIIILLSEDKKNRPFQRYHAVNSLAFAVAFSVVLMIISAVTFGFGACLFILYFIAFYWAYEAYQGKWVVVPFLTDFVKKQGWI